MVVVSNLLTYKSNLGLHMGARTNKQTDGCLYSNKRNKTSFQCQMVSFSSHLYFASQNSVAAIVTRLQARRSGVWIPAGAWGFSLLQNVESLPLGSTQPSIPSVLEVPSLAGECMRHEADHPPPSSARFRNEWSYTSNSPCMNMQMHGDVSFS
jgi:hypothetical protein